MALTMRPTGLGSGIDKDRQDYTIYSGGWDNGRIYEVRGGPDHLRWFWSFALRERAALMPSAGIHFPERRPLADLSSRPFVSRLTALLPTRGQMLRSNIGRRRTIMNTKYKIALAVLASAALGAAAVVYCGPVLRHPAGPIQAANFRSAIAF
jgi:hypothetical protein